MRDIQKNNVFLPAQKTQWKCSLFNTQKKPL